MNELPMPAKINFKPTALRYETARPIMRRREVASLNLLAVGGGSRQSAYVIEAIEETHCYGVFLDDSMPSLSTVPLDRHGSILKFLSDSRSYTYNQN